MRDLLKDISSMPAPTDERLATLESAVWSRVASRRAERLETRGRIGALGLALAIGAAGGGLAPGQERPPSELQILTVEAAMEPFSIASRLG